jgi:CO/xanthine dehydrogenase Mo-binding subunit
MPSTIGLAMRRLEDPRLITGQGRYAGDIKLPNLARVIFVRSSQPHASIRSVDVEAARAMPGVIAVWTAADLPEPARAIPDWQPRGVTPRPRTVLSQGEVVEDALRQLRPEARINQLPITPTRIFETLA